MTAGGASMTQSGNMGEQVGQFKCLPGTIPTKYLPGSCK
jgi:hypothetical protein